MVKYTCYDPAAIRFPGTFLARDRSNLAENETRAASAMMRTHSALCARRDRPPHETTRQAVEASLELMHAIHKRSLDRITVVGLDAFADEVEALYPDVVLPTDISSIAKTMLQSEPEEEYGLKSLMPDTRIPTPDDHLDHHLDHHLEQPQQTSDEPW